MEKDRISAIVLAAGRGRRMGGNVPKQYLELCGKPLICHTLSVFEESAVDEVILVTAAEDVSFCQTELVEKYGFSKVRAIVAGGAERYDSVWQGLQQVRGEFVLIHDGARAFVTAELIDRGIAAAKESGAAVIGMPSKDTVKLTDENGTVLSTPDRSAVWIVQTPQCFATSLIKNAYQQLFDTVSIGERKHITDDAMVVELLTNHPVRMVEGSYENLKVTTPEDLVIGEGILKRRGC